MNISLQDYETACEYLANEFAHKYFGKDVEIWWIAEEIGGVLCIADYFFSMRDISDFIRYKYTRKMMFKYYDYNLKAREEGADWVLSIKSFIKSKLAKA